MRQLAPRRPSTYAIEALLDSGEAFVDEGFVLSVGEDVGPVIFDCLANQFADIERIDAIVDPFLKRLDELGERSFRWRRAADLTITVHAAADDQQWHALMVAQHNRRTGVGGEESD